MQYRKWLIVGGLMTISFLLVTGAATAAVAEEGGTSDSDNNAGLIAIGIGIVMLGTGLATGLAEKSVGSAAVGAMAEDPENFGMGKGITMMVLPETIVLFGFVIAIQLMGKM